MNQKLQLPVKLASLLILIALWAVPGVGWGQISITTLETPITENFNTLANTGTSSIVPSGWSFLESGSNANTSYTAGTGSGNGGDTYSFGAASATDRAFGTLLSANLISTLGVSFTNNSGEPINALEISFTGEQWRLGATGREDRLDFQYSLNASSLTTGTWVDVNQLDFVAPITTGTVGALDGNASANRTSKSFIITGLNIANGSSFWIRFSDFNASGADDGLAVDDWSLNAIPFPPSLSVTPVILSNFSYALGAGPSPEQSFSISGSNLTSDVSIDAPTNYEISTGTGVSFSAADPISLTPTSGTLATTTIYVRLKAGLAIGNYNNENITASSTGADNVTVTCNGNVYDQIDWCNLQWPASGTITLGDGFNVYGRAWVNGVSNEPGATPGLQAWVGYSTVNSNPDTWTNWIPASFNAQIGNDDEFVANLGAAISSQGTYYYAYRYQYNSAPYVYGGTGGFWNNNNGTLTVNPFTAQIDWCNLQSPASGIITAGGTFNVYAQVYEPGITPGEGAGSGISAWIGYSTANDNPATGTGWTWVPATHNAAVAGNNDEYMANIATGLTPGTYYYASRFKYSLADYVYGGYNAGGGGFWDGSANVSGELTVNFAEPIAHVSNLTAIANSSTSITVSWDDSDATGYLIKASDVSYEAITAPVDGIAEVNSALVRNVASGFETWQFTGLTSGSTYYFKVFPYNGSGTMVNYYLEPTVPQASVATPSGPTVLQAGDIAILQVNTSTPDRLAFITYVELNPETVINFTDNGFTSATAVRTGEGFLTYTAPTTIPAGTVISWNNGMTIAGTGWNSNNPSNFALGGGDQIFAYQGTWGTDQTLICGTSLSQWITTGSGSSSTSYLPSALSNNINAFAFSNTVDNAYYSGITSGTKNVISSLITHHLNWTSSSSNQGAQTWSFSFGNSTNINGPATLLNLTISGSESLTLGSSGALTVNGSFANSGLLTIADGGSLITNGTVTGTATVQKNISDSDFHLFTLPVNQQLPASPTFIGYYVDDYIEANGEWTRLVDADNLQPLRGYSISNESGALSLDFTGNLFTGDQSFPGLSYTPAAGGYLYGWNLVGNPFPSAIDMDVAVLAATGLNGFAYVWNGSNYVSGPLAGGAGTLTGNIIPSAQGFFVRTEAAGASLTIPNAARIHNTQSFYKSSETFDNTIMLTASGNGAEDRMMFAVNMEATAGYDSNFDAYKLFGNADAPQLYTTAADLKLSISSVDVIEAETEFPVLFKAGVDGNYTITSSYPESFMSGSQIILTDLLTGLRHDLRQNPVYAFSAAAGDDANRFKLSFATVGIEEPSGLNIGVYAAGNQIRLVLPELMKGKVNISNLSGQLLYSQNFNGSGEIGIGASYQAGVYLVTVISANGSTTRKVFVN